MVVPDPPNWNDTEWDERDQNLEPNGCQEALGHQDGMQKLEGIPSPEPLTSLMDIK